MDDLHGCWASIPWALGVLVNVRVACCHDAVGVSTLILKDDERNYALQVK